MRNNCKRGGRKNEEWDVTEVRPSFSVWIKWDACGNYEMTKIYYIIIYLKFLSIFNKKNNNIEGYKFTWYDLGFEPQVFMLLTFS